MRSASVLILLLLIAAPATAEDRVALEGSARKQSVTENVPESAEILAADLEAHLLLNEVSGNKVPEASIALVAGLLMLGLWQRRPS